MKGLIAPLLALMMTGMVFSQQPQSSRFGSDEGTGSAQLLNQYLLVMDDDLIQGLKTEGELQSEIGVEDRSTVDHIVFHSSSLNSQRSDIKPFNISRAASVNRRGALEFRLNDSLLQTMRRQGLQYVIRPQDRGRYNEVVVSYQSPGNVRQVSNDDRPIRSQTEQRATNQQRVTNQQRSNGQRFGGNRNDDVAFRGSGVRDREPPIGPLLPEELATSGRRYPEADNTDFMNRSRRITGLNTNTRDTNYESALKRRRDLDRQDEQPRSRQIANNQFPRNDDVDLDRQNAWQRNRTNTILDDRNLPDRNLTNRNSGFVASEPVLRNDRRLNSDSRQLNSDARRLTSDSRRLVDDRLIDDQFIDDRFVDDRLVDDRLVDDRMITERRLADRELQISEIEKRKLAQQNEKLRQLLLDEKINSDRDNEILRDRRLAALVRDRDRRGYDDDYRSPFDDDRFVDFPKRRNSYSERRVDDYDDPIIVGDTRPIQQHVSVPGKRSSIATPAPSGRLPAFAIDGPIVDQRDVGAHSRTNQALWFIMLCSVGLNFYLFWIARGFYVRYEELADEIRDSFTGSSIG